MSPSFNNRGHRVHRYYVSAALQQGGDIAEDLAIRRIPAQPTEALVIDRLQMLARSPGQDWSRLGARLRRVEVHSDTVQGAPAVGRIG